MSAVAPEIPDDAAEDVPPQEQAEVAKRAVQDPDGQHRRVMAKTKLSFGISLIAGCLVVYVGLSVGQYATQARFPEAAALTSAMDLLKLVATTALGFVFGRTLENDKRD